MREVKLTIKEVIELHDAYDHFKQSKTYFPAKNHTFPEFAKQYIKANLRNGF